MKDIESLRNPDMIEINGEKFQVINNTRLWYHTDKNEAEMVVELIKVGEKSLTPSYRLTYILDKMKFFHFKGNKWVEKNISKINF